MEHFKSGFVSIIGRPNVGKSTVMNHIIGQKIAITSNKAQTTRNQIQTIYNNEEGQIVFVDTPGINRPKNKLGEFMLGEAERTLNEVDVILWIVEPSDFVGAAEQYIIEKLKKVKTPVILVINKMDTVSEEEIFKSISFYKNQYDFKEIVPVSALKEKNIDELIKTIFIYLKEGPQYYDKDMVTNQPERSIVAEIIREKALRSLDKEVPHGIAVEIQRMKQRENKNMIDIEATIVCERESHKGIIIGKKGSMLKKIGMLARQDMEELLDAKVFLTLWVKVKKDWRDSDFLLKNYGFKNDDY